ncbi:formate dehydrogenase [Bordetella petrii]|uniref:formate dehydrogenase n=1 Tax=Bordetella petrii TaxID=94624 RepID=UPI00373435CC
MPQKSPPLSRRMFLAGTTTAAAAAAGAAVLPSARPAGQPAAAPAAAPAKGGGYRLSEHVKRYYKTTLV